MGKGPERTCYHFATTTSRNTVKVRNKLHGFKTEPGVMYRRGTFKTEISFIGPLPAPLGRSLIKASLCYSPLPIRQSWGRTGSGKIWTKKNS